MSDFYRAAEAAAYLRVTPQTLRKYRLQGKIQGYETPGGQHLYKLEDLQKLIKGPQQLPETKNDKMLVFYVRASDGDNNKINKQIKQLTEKYGTPNKIYKDKASGLNENRTGLNRLIKDAQKNKIKEIRFTQKDRLTRFGYKYLETYFTDKNIIIGAAFDKADKTLHEELMQDFMSLIASFSGKYYRMRGYEQKQQLLKDAKKELDKGRN